MRLTYELGHGKTGEYDTINDKDMPANNIWKAINKLGQLEDIEEELEIDLLDYLKQIAKGIKQIRENNVIPNGVIVYIKGATYKITKDELK